MSDNPGNKIPYESTIQTFKDNSDIGADYKGLKSDQVENIDDKNTSNLYGLKIDFPDPSKKDDLEKVPQYYDFSQGTFVRVEKNVKVYDEGCLFNHYNDIDVNTTTPSNMFNTNIGAIKGSNKIGKNFFRTGKSLRATACGVLKTAGSVNLTIQPKLGNSLASKTILGINLPVLSSFEMTLLTTCRSLVGAGNFVSGGHIMIDNYGFTFWDSYTGSIDVASDNYYQWIATWSAAGCDLITTNFTLEVIN